MPQMRVTHTANHLESSFEENNEKLKNKGNSRDVERWKLVFPGGNKREWKKRSKLV